MNISRHNLYAMGEPLGDGSTRHKAGGRIYGSGGGGGGTSTTQNSVDERFSPLIDYATQAAAGVQQAGFNPYSGQRYEGTNATQQAGLNMTTNRALNGDPTVNAGANFLQGALQSGPTSATVNPYAQQGNPYLDAMVNKAQSSVLSNAQGAAVRSGSFGNSGIADAAAKQMGDVATSMYGNAYGQQAQLAESGAGRNDAMYQSWMGNNLQAANLGQQYGNQAYQDAGQLMNAGQFTQDAGQRNKDFAFNQFQDQQNTPYKQMAAYSGLLGASGSTGSSTTTQSGGGK